MNLTSVFGAVRLRSTQKGLPALTCIGALSTWDTVSTPTDASHWISPGFLYRTGSFGAGARHKSAKLASIPTRERFIAFSFVAPIPTVVLRTPRRGIIEIMWISNWYRSHLVPNQSLRYTDEEELRVPSVSVPVVDINGAFWSPRQSEIGDGPARV